MRSMPRVWHLMEFTHFLLQTFRYFIFFNFSLIYIIFSTFNHIRLAWQNGWLTRLTMHVVDGAGAGAGAGCIFGLAWLSLADGVSLNTLSNDGVLNLAWLGFCWIVWLTGLNYWLGNLVVYFGLARVLRQLCVCLFIYIYIHTHWLG